jgi:D-glycero-D-manno-heptose 1,7-bisphosphate phosphatase
MSIKRKALFLDRDGVINQERGTYTFRIDDFKILPSVMDTLKSAQDLGYLLIIITNQGGIAKGIYSHEDVNNVHEYLSQQLRKQDIQLTDIFYSPHHEEFGKSLDRKPDSLMLEKAIAMYDIDPKQSFMIGDSKRDIIASEKVNVTGFLIEPNTSINFILNHLK